MAAPLLLTFHASEEDRIALEMGLTLAKYYNSHLDVWHVLHNAHETLQSLALTIPDSVMDALAEAEEETEQAAAQKLFHDFIFATNAYGIATLPGNKQADLLKREHPQAQWHICESNPEALLIRECMLHDLIILTIQENEKHYNPSQIIAQSGKPVLMMPKSAKPAPLTHAGLLWNESAEASVALNYAIPFLRNISEFSIICSADTPKESQSGLVRYLNAHHISPNIMQLDKNAPSSGESLHHYVQDAGCDLIVMGAFSKQNLAKKIFGGVTQYMLEHSSLPLFIAH